MFAFFHPFSTHDVLAGAEAGDWKRFDFWRRFWTDCGIPFEVDIDLKGSPALKTEERIRFWARELKQRNIEGVVIVSDEPGGAEIDRAAGRARQVLD